MVFQVPEKYLGGRGENQESWNYQKNSFIAVALLGNQDAHYKLFSYDNW